MRAWVIERATGAAVAEIEAATSYDLFQALLSWGERQGLPRFKVPLHYRTERNPTFGEVGETAPPAPTNGSVPAARRRSPRPPDTGQTGAAGPERAAVPPSPGAEPVEDGAAPLAAQQPALMPLEKPVAVPPPRPAGRQRRRIARGDDAPPEPEQQLRLL